MIRSLTIIFFFALLVPQVVAGQSFREMDGSNNNLDHPSWGQASTALQQLCTVSYADGMSEPTGQARPNPRQISNNVFAQDDFVASPQDINDFGWGFGQFIDHDITFSLDTIPEIIEIPIPMGDPDFDPFGTGEQKIFMRRSDFDRSTGNTPENPRAPVNSITSWIDGSGVYGSDDERIQWLRTYEMGKLKTSAGNLLAYNTIDGEYDSPVDPTAPFMLVEGHPAPEKFFVAGDIRANEQPSLLSFHTLFVREHNRLCDSLAQTNPGWDDEELFQMARKIVGALIQVVTYEEWLPTLGIDPEPYQGYNPAANGTIFNIFSAAAYRLGHSLVNDQILRLHENGDTWTFGSIQIKDAFFQPDIMRLEGGVEPIFRGMLTQPQQKFDHKIVGTLRNFLFGPPGAGGLDLMVLNIARGRERGLPDYNTVRTDFGLSAKPDFEAISQDPGLVASLENTYESVDDIDPWVGMISETPFQDAVVGETMYSIIRRQFTALREGDRFYYEHDPSFSEDEVLQLKNTRLSHIIARNTGINGLPEDVFHVSTYPGNLVTGITPFKSIRKIDIEAYPNPAIEKFTIRILTRAAGEAYLNLSDLQGRTIRAEQLSLQRGDNEFTFYFDQTIRNGLYLISLKTADGIGELKIVKR